MSIVKFHTNQLVFYTVDAAHNGIRHPVVIINLINLFHLPFLLLYDALMDKLGNLRSRTHKYILSQTTQIFYAHDASLLTDR